MRPRAAASCDRSRLADFAASLSGQAHWDPASVMLRPLPPRSRNGVRLSQRFMEHKCCTEIICWAERWGSLNQETVAMLWIAGISFAGAVASSALLYVLFCEWLPQ